MSANPMGIICYIFARIMYHAVAQLAIFIFNINFMPCVNAIASITQLQFQSRKWIMSDHSQNPKSNKKRLSQVSLYHQTYLP